VKRSTNLLLLLIVNLLWAGQFPAYKIASEHMRVVNLNFWTFVIATITLVPFLIAERRRQATPWVVTKKARMMREFLVLGIVGVIPPSVFLSWGIAHSTASNAAIISLVVPVLMALMAVVMLGERMTTLRWISFGVAILGTLLISKITWTGSFLNVTLLVGNAVIFFSWMGAAFYNAYCKKLLSQYSGLEVLVYGYIVAFVTCAIISLVEGGPFFYDILGQSAGAWGGILVLGVLSWGLSMVLWMSVLKQLDVSQISVSVYLLPLFGVILSAVTLGERLTAPQIGGGVLVLVATLSDVGL
jgi:drug/metabolite transporter (DMT)-like permease